MNDFKRVESLWDLVRRTGMSDLLKGLNLLSYLFILKALEDRSFQLGPRGITFRGPEAAACRWSVIKERAREDGEHCARHLRENVGPWLRSLDPGSCLDDASPVFAQLLPQLIARIMIEIDTLCESSRAPREAFEAIVRYAEREGAFQPRAGQIMTPPHIASLMADLLRPQPGEKSLDMSCGTGNLLVAASQSLQRFLDTTPQLLADGRYRGPAPFPSDPPLIGVDYSPQMIPPCYAHLLLCGIERPQIRCSDALSRSFYRSMTETAPDQVDIILANPPFSGYLDSPDLSEPLQKVRTGDTELLFVELALLLLRKEGRAAFLLPEGMLRNPSRAASALRCKLLQENQVNAVISFPAGVFLPQASMKTSLVMVTRGGQTRREILFYEVREDGFVLDHQRREKPGQTDLWDVRFLYAAHAGQSAPVRGVFSQDDWNQYTATAASQYVLPRIEEREAEAFVAGFDCTEVCEEHAWFVAPEDIAPPAYNLCATIYRPAPVADRFLLQTRARRKRA